MSTKKFREIRLSKANKERLALINQIIRDYQADGYTLTLRQLYYQLVSRDLIPNEDSEYKKLGKLLVEGRMGGIVSWDAIEDRTRKVKYQSAWDSPKSLLESAARQFRLDRRRGQDCLIEVWVEKDALSQVVNRACVPYGVSVMVNRGYGSVTAMHDAYERFLINQAKFRKHLILYLGDHDPSGIDMVRDVESRINKMLEVSRCDAVEVKHIALTMEQIRQYNPPPNPAKITDSRAAEYIEKFGPTSWEVDALPPNILNQLIVDNIESMYDMEVWGSVVEEESDYREQLNDIASKF